MSSHCPDSTAAKPAPFWEVKPLAELTSEEWESLCDGCAKCCLVRLEDEEDGTVYTTRLHCQLLDAKSCRCRDYSNRLEVVPDCFKLTPENLSSVNWLPASCSYRRLQQGKHLPAWHPLISGDKNSVHRKGKSVQGRVVSELFVHPDDLEEHIIHWIED